ncbi:hypothetical protein E3N88_25696 [Mikania micrantha]|uniref:Uncharacterized protein n=1 Tax=Mikania micrantha TaxID=192012 RepID=A0A5N6N898_9ASTR|nr:hypothetical protein E3N88_25696 [Mikania micrantha]
MTETWEEAAPTMDSHSQANCDPGITAMAFGDATGITLQHLQMPERPYLHHHSATHNTTAATTLPPQLTPPSLLSWVKNNLL